MSRTRSLLGWGVGLTVLGWLAGCGMKPAAPDGQTTGESAPEPVALPAPGPAPEDTGTPVDPAPPGPSPDESAPGRLCGPASRPCTVEIEETIPAVIADAWSLRSATLLLDGQQRPHLFAAGAMSGGALAVRAHDGTWSYQKLPEDWSSAAFTLRGDERLVTRGEFEGNEPLTVWKWVEGDWRLESDLGLPLRLWEGLAALRTDHQGQLHAVLRTKEVNPGIVYAAEAEGWRPHVSGSDEDGEVMSHAGFDLSTHSGAHLAYWKRASDPKIWTLFWQAGANLPERVLSLSLSVFSDNPREFVLGLARDEHQEGLETRHLFFTRPQEGLTDLQEITHAMRTGEGAWTVRPLLPTELLTPRCLDTPPRTPADSCEEEFITHGMGPLVTSGTELRFFPARVHIGITQYARCPGYDYGGSCDWQVDHQTYAKDTKMVWVEGERTGTVDLPQVPEGFDVVAAQADAKGRLHLMIRRNEYPEQWRYLRLGARP